MQPHCVADGDVGKCLRFLTELNQEEIEALDKSRQQQPGKRDSQRRIAQELTRLVHGEDGLAKAERATKIFFGEEISGWTDAELGRIFADVQSCEVARDVVNDGLSLIDGLTQSGLCKSKGEARRTIQEGGAYVNNERMKDVELKLTPKHLASESVIVLRRGKRKFALVRLT